MKPNQKLVQGDVQVALFPMEYLRITQGRYSNFSHKGYNAYDLAGKDGSREKWYAPFDIKVEWLDNGIHKTGVVVANTKRVLMANGQIAEPYTLSIMLWHDNDISGLRVGQVYKQGEYFYMEGTAGYATGAHIHMELSYWKYDGTYPLFKLKNGYWTLKGKELNIEDLFFNNDTVILDTKGYKFKKYTAPKVNIEKEVYAFTANTNINIRDGYSTKDKIVGLLKKGETYNYIQKVAINGYVWVGNGKTWLAVREVKDGVRQPLWGTLQPQKAKLNIHGQNLKVGDRIQFSLLYNQNINGRALYPSQMKYAELRNKTLVGWGYITEIMSNSYRVSNVKGRATIGFVRPINVY